MPPLPSTNAHVATETSPNYSQNTNRGQQQHPIPIGPKAKNQSRASSNYHQEYPVVWRWVPSTELRLLAGYSADPPVLSASTPNPRVIYATANRVDGNSTKDNTTNKTDDSSLLLTGGELRQARKVLSREKTNPLASTARTSASLINVPTAPLAGPPQTLGLGSTQLSARPTQRSGMNSKKGRDMEVANLLLHIGERTSNDKNVANTKTTKSSPPEKKIPARKLRQGETKLQDEYLKNWVAGSVSLHTPEDDDVLSPLHCFMRRYCVEAFSARDEEVATPRYGKSHGFKVEVGQVGIRCLHCKDLAPAKRAERAICYPSSLRNIYHSIETWQRRHSHACEHIPLWVRKSILDLMESSKTRAGGRRQYWEDSAKRLGMVDTSRGVRFARTPGDLGPLPSSEATYQNMAAPDVPGHEPKPVILPSDEGLVTDYLFLLMNQMQTCRFTEADRTGGRSKIKDSEVGFPGMECRHCQGRAGFGRYFPTSVAALSLANSDRNVYNHLKKCRRCPEHIKKKLMSLNKSQSQSKNRRGLRKIFFHRIWKRIHGDVEETEKNPELKEEKVTTPSLPPAHQPKPFPQFVPYAGMVTTVPRVPASMMTLPYPPNIYPQISLRNFRGY